MSDLSILREKIDTIDDEIVALLMKRAELVVDVREAKKRDKIDIYSSSRERQIVDRVLAIAKEGSFPLAQLERIFINIIGASRSLIGDLRVSYLKSSDSSALEAARAQFGEAVEFSSEADLETVIANVEGGESQFGVVPVRSPAEGFCFRTFEILTETSLSIIAEIQLNDRFYSKSGANDPRYVALGHTPALETGNDKTAVLCSLSDRPGALREVLEPFSDRDLTLFKIESRQSIKDSSKYLFYLEIHGHRNEARVAEALAALEPLTDFAKVLGSYPNVYRA